MNDDATRRVRPQLRCFSPIELRMMCADGDLQRHGIPGFEFYLPYGDPPTPLDRARSLAALARAGRIITGPAAAWVHHGGPAPRRIEVSRRTGSRPRELDDVVDWCYRRIDAADIVEIGPLRLTSVERTRADLARRAATAQAGPQLFCTR